MNILSRLEFQQGFVRQATSLIAASVRLRRGERPQRAERQALMSLRRTISSTTPSNLQSALRMERMQYVDLSPTDTASSFILQTTLMGMESLIPGLVRTSQIETDQRKMEFAIEFFNYQMTLNELCDFSGGRENEHTPFIRQFRTQVIMPRLEVLEKRLITMAPSPEQQALISTYRQDLEFIETLAKKRYREKGIGYSLNELEQYRLLANAIYTAGIMSAILGTAMPSSLRLYEQDGELTEDALYQKYSWLLNQGSIEEISPAQRTGIIMHNFLMALQVDSDWSNREVNMSLGIPTFATVALQTNDRPTARKILRKLSRAYQIKAEKYGLSVIGSKFSFSAQKFVVDGVARRIRREHRRRVNAHPDLEHTLESFSPTIVRMLGVFKRAAYYRDSLFAQNCL